MSCLQAGHTEFPLPKLFSKYYVNNFEKHLAQSYQVLYTDVTLYRLSHKHIGMFQNKTCQWTNCSNFIVVADGRTQNVWSLPEIWLHLERTAALEGMAQRMLMTIISSPSPSFSDHTFHIQIQ